MQYQSEEGEGELFCCRDSILDRKPAQVLVSGGLGVIEEQHRVAWDY